jgi:hypothetical protein
MVRRFETAEQVKECHILFINLKGKEKIRSAIEALKGQSILTVSDTDGFVRSGGMIRFVTENNRTRIRIDIVPAEEVGLIISPKLLRLAEIYSPKNN